MDPPHLAQSNLLVFQPWRTLGRSYGQGCI